MLKNVFYLVLLFQGSFSLAAINLKWLGGSSFLISDERSSILIDPAWTRPNFMHWLGLKKFECDPVLLDEVVKRADLKSLTAVVVTHSHYDHIVDAPCVAKKMGAIFYVDKNFEKVATAYGENAPSLKQIGVNQSESVGSFKVTGYQRNHSPLFFGIDFLPGNIPDNFDFGFWDYKAGRTWVYLIEHNDGKILIHNTHDEMQELKRYRPDIHEIDILIQGVTKSDPTPLINGYAKGLKPKIFITNHFDNFLLPFDFERTVYLPTINLNKVKKEMNNKYPEMLFIIPELWTEMSWKDGKLQGPEDPGK